MLKLLVAMKLKLMVLMSKLTLVLMLKLLLVLIFYCFVDTVPIANKIIKDA